MGDGPGTGWQRGATGASEKKGAGEIWGVYVTELLAPVKGRGVCETLAPGDGILAWGCKLKNGPPSRGGESVEERWLWAGTGWEYAMGGRTHQRNTMKRHGSGSWGKIRTGKKVDKRPRGEGRKSKTQAWGGRRKTGEKGWVLV